MASHTRPTKPHVDDDGVRIYQTSGVRRAVWLLVLAMGLVSVALLVVARPLLRSRSDELVRPPARATTVSAVHDTAAARPPAKPARRAVAAEEQAAAPPNARVEGRRAPAHDAEPTPPSEEAPMFGVSDAAPGEPSGVGLFPPPGTKPIKRGIIVPEDFELPPGYVRHYQATDDGQRVAAILMFHPDYKPVDEHGQPIALPEDRVVPSDMAPPGLPVQMLEVPENPAQAQEVPENQGAEKPAP